MTPDRPRLVGGGGDVAPATDPRVEAVLEVLAGERAAVVAQRWAVDVAVLHRWVRAFVAAGTAQVTNRPDEDQTRQRDRFLAAFAHETRTPLTVAQGWVTMLLEEELPPAMVARTVARLGEALHRLSEHSRDVELLAAASLGLLHATPEPVSVAELVEHIDPVPSLSGQAGTLELIVDPELFGRVIRDLVREARNARPEPRSVRVEAERRPPWVEVRVVRDGDPIDPAVLRALFEPFDLNDDASGVTIGLYLARALAVAHGGSVGLDQDDDGAVFWVRVPERRSRDHRAPLTDPPSTQESP